MKLILAHRHDASAQALAGRWGDDALLLTAADLHRFRWRLELDPDGAVRTGLATAGGDPVPVDGVLNRLGVISEADLRRIRPSDRLYATAEFTAFLTAWLDACPAPVLNRPQGGGLNGPAWGPEHWATAAARVGLRPSAVRRRIALGISAQPEPDPVWPEAVAVRMVAGRCFGDVHPEVAGRLAELARVARTPLLAATVEGPGPQARAREFSAWPDLSDPEVADAVADALRPDAAGVPVAGLPRVRAEVTA
jgi:hypothetical protein